jgi:WD40 repeat protein
VSYSPDGRYLASGGGDTTVRFWDTLTSLPRHTCLGHRNHVLCTAWAPNGKRFASADKNGEIRLWDPVTGKPVGEALRCGHCSPFAVFHHGLKALGRRRAFTRLRLESSFSMCIVV